MAYYGALEPVFENNNPAISKWKEIFIACGFAYTAFFIAVIVNLITPAARSTGVPHSWWKSGAFPLGWLVLFYTYKVIAPKFAARPKQMTAIAATASFIFLGSLYIGNEQLANQATWIFMAGVLIRSLSFDRDRLRSMLDFRNWAFVMLLLSSYTLMVFDGLPARYGGGALIPATLFLEKPIAWLHSTTVDASLLDENDLGYYIVPPGKNKALFVPRSDVSSLYYGRADELEKPH